jgi:hypothetical protein
MFENRTIDSIEYRVWTGKMLKTGDHPNIGKYPNLWHGTELTVTPQTIVEIARRAIELNTKTKFDILRFNASREQDFDRRVDLTSLAPFVFAIAVEEHCKKLDLDQLYCFDKLLSILVRVKKIKNLKLANFLSLWSATLGKVDDADVLEGAVNLENLILLQRLDIAKTGWEWLATLPKLKKFEMIQFEIASLVGITPNPSIETLGIAYPRTFVSFEGIEVFSGVKRLEIEGAKQISDLSPIGDLKNLRQLDIISSAKPKSWDFLKKLPNLEWAAFDGETIWENGEFTKKSLKLVAP